MAARPYAETAAALLVRDGKVLMGLRAKWKPVWAGVWDAIGGRLEPGEEVTAALAREVREEIGVEITHWAFLDKVQSTDTKTGIVTLCNIFAVLDWEGEPENICDEHEEIAWFTLEEVAAIDDLAGENYPELARQAVQLARDGWTG